MGIGLYNYEITEPEPCSSAYMITTDPYLFWMFLFGLIFLYLYFAHNISKLFGPGASLLGMYIELPPILFIKDQGTLNLGVRI